MSAGPAAELREAGGLPYRYLPAASDKPAAGVLVLLHGRGADDLDLLPLLDVLDPERRLVGVVPRAPLTLQGAPGFHWYEVHRVGFPHAESFFTSLPLLEQLIEDVLDQEGMSHDQLVVGGFSQGAVMSYASALGTGRPRPAGVFGLSGFVPTVEGWQLDAATPHGLPVFAAHGTFDPVIVVDFGRAAAETMRAAGADLTWREVPIDHSIAPTTALELRDWLRAALP